MTFFKRHARQLSLYAFFITPLISQISPIIISIDPIGNTAYYLEPYLPSFQRDLHMYDIRVNGELGLPLSTFVFDIEESTLTLNDSLRTRSAFHFIKGDYGFRNLSVKIQSLTLNGGTLTGFAHTRSYNGFNGMIGEGSIMQNYLLSYKNSFKNSNFSITTAYHNEDMNEPISNNDFTTKVNENYFSGLSLSHQTRFGQFSYHSDLQVSKTEIDDVNEKWISNQRAAFKFNQRERFTPFLKWSQNRENQQFYRGGFAFGDSLTFMIINLAYINTSQIELLFSKKIRNAYIQIDRKFLDDYTDYGNNYILNSLIIGAAKNAFYVQIIPSVVTTKGYTYNSYFGGFGYNGDVVMINIEGKLYNSNTWLVKSLFRSEIQINFPYFERYTPYLKLDYINYFLEKPASITHQSSILEVVFDELNENIHRLNLEFGYKLETFRISYHIRNMLGEDGRFTNNYEQVPIHKYLKVEWQFRN